MEEDINGDNETSLMKKLKNIAEEIKQSWVKDTDRTEYMISLTNMINEIIQKDSLEEYFSNNEEILNYFMGEFMKEVIQYILIQPIIFGDNGDEIGLELLLNICKLFLKFHKNNKYATLFEKIRDIFNQKNSHTFFTCHDQRNDKPIKQYDFNKFNKVYNSEFEKNERKKFEIGQEVDISIDNKHCRDMLDRKCWVRGRIKDIQDNEYIVEYCEEDDEKRIPLNDFNIFPAGKKTVDWDWRLNLKKYDIVDGYDRAKWFPSTIVNVIENEINGFKQVKYKVGFRLYPQHFKNSEDENDVYEKYTNFWNSQNIGKDSENQDFVGDGEGMDEIFPHYSKKLQKFNTFSKYQPKNLDYYSNYYQNDEQNKKIRLMNENLQNDNEISVEDFYNYEINGKKNCIIGKDKNFEIYYAIFLKKMENENFFSKFIEILQDNPNAEEIYNIFYIFINSFSYIHKDYFKENSSIIKNSLTNFINNLDDKEMRNLPKNLLDIISYLLTKISSYSSDGENDKEFIDLYDEITLTLSVKTIKTSIFDRRLQGIKTLNEYIDKNKNDENNCLKVIKLIKDNGIIQEIFGTNYHSQIINKSTEIIKLLLLKNELSEEDIKLIWSCTKRGDLEAKINIMKLLTELADNLKEDYIEMLLKSIRENIEKKINDEEIELVYKLSVNKKNSENNQKNILICGDYLCQCLLSLNNTKIDNNHILDKLLSIVEKGDIYLEKVLDICKNCLKKNEKAILSYTILFKIMEKISYGSNPIKNIISDKYLLNLFEDNFRLYIKQAKELLEKDKIPFSDAGNIDKFIIDGFTHLENVQKRIEIFPYLINYFYKDYDFLPFLKEVLITNAVCPNDQLIFYDFLRKYLFDDDIHSIETDESKMLKNRIRQELFELISDDNNKTEINEEQFKLFIELFSGMNKDIIKENVIDEENIDKLKGLDKLWKIIFKIKDETVLSEAIKLIFQMYHKNLEKLLEKCTNYIKDENATPEVINKCIILLKLIIVQSEKNIFFKTKSHLSLLKNCLINIPLELKHRQLLKSGDKEKYMFLGNTTLNDLRIILSGLFDLPPKRITFSFSDEYLNKIKEIKNLENKKMFERNHLDDEYNSYSLYELLLLKNNVVSDLKPNEKIEFSHHRMEREPIMIDDEINPKLKIIFQEWFKEFTGGTMKMDNKAALNYIKGVTKTNLNNENDDKVIEFIESNDNDNKGYLTEEEFINFYKKKSNNVEIIWRNLALKNIREDLKKKGDPFPINYIENEKLPRYKLGNDLSLIQNIIQQYYKNPNENSSILEFLLYLTTNENIYNDVLNMYKEDNKDSLVNKALNDKNKYIEHNYIFIIIESIFQDLEIYFYNKNMDSDSYINLGYDQYKLVQNKYEPFDNDEKIEKKINFVKNLLKLENFEKIVKYVNNLLEIITNVNNDKNANKNISNILYTCCLRGLKILNIVDNFYSNNDKENAYCIKELKENNIYNLGYCNLSSLFDNSDYKNELSNNIYLDLTNNLINYLNTKNTEENKDDEMSKYFYNKCFDLLIDLLSSKKSLLKEYTSSDDKKNQTIIDLFRNNLSNTDKDKKTLFMNNIDQSIIKALQNNINEYIFFLYQICNSLLDNLLNFQNVQEEDSNKNIFNPDSTFFDLYNRLYKIVNRIKEEEKKDKKNIINLESDKDNSFLEKIYNLLMKGLSDTPFDDKDKKDDKIILSLLKLFLISTKDDENLKNEILFKEKDGETLFDLLFNRYISQINNSKNEELSNNNNDNENKENENDKFICLETVKEEKKEDNSSKEELNELCNKFFLECFKDSKNPKIIQKLIELIKLLKKITKKKKNGRDSESDSDDKNDDDTPSSNQIHHYSSRQHGHVGLKNLGCICYMNSIMQQIYMVPTFRYAIMHADDGESPNPSSNYRHSVDDDNLLHQLQIMYTYLTFSERMDYNPRDFCYSFKDFDGSPINVGAQQDSQEFYNNFCDKIENNLKKTHFKYIVNDVFTGRTCSSVLCQGCKNISNRFEDFYNLTLEVKNINNLNDSLQKLIVPEIIDDFKCSNCNQNVRISKITSLNKLPNVLVVHLKRFYLDYETCHTRKINSKFEFPKKLNLKLFCVEEITKNFGTNTGETTDIYNKEDEYYQYELKGINVHTGSADGGHYFSFIDVDRDGKDNIMNENVENKNNWLTFNDSHVSEFDTDKIPSECYGGSNEGYSYENCQNAYLLIYERKKKTPIRIIINENEVQSINEENIIKVNKDNRNEINKEYDLSRIGGAINEENLYQKIFFDEERNEYYKYIPYYNIPKYAPRKTYLEVMKENNKTPTTKNSNKTFNIKLRKYREILINKITSNDFDINNDMYTEESKENILSVVLSDFMKKLNKKQSWNADQTEEINKEYIFIMNKLIKPLINENTSYEILTLINKSLTKEENCQKIFNNSNNIFSRNSDQIISFENVKLIVDVYNDLINIFYKKIDDNNYSKEFKIILEQIFSLIKGSKTKKSYMISYSNDDKEENAIIYIYDLLYKLLTTNERIFSIFIDNKLISNLVGKLDEEKKEIRKIICDILLYAFKNTKYYNNELFDLKEGEEPGKYELKDKPYLSTRIDKETINILFEENKELLYILIVILEYDDKSFTNEFNEHIYRLFSEYREKNKEEDLLNLLVTLIKINDTITFIRLYTWLGYPKLVVKPIPREKKENKYYNSYTNSNYDSDDDDDNYYHNNYENKEENTEKVKQKWPLFGERLIDGDIKKQLYEYTSPNHLKKYNICLLSLLFPSEYSDIDKQKDESNEDSNNFYNRFRNNSDDEEITKKLKITEELKKSILLDILHNCFGKKNNYGLFKYIYLMPARSLFYKNLYEEIISYLKEDKSIDLEIKKEKEEKYIKNIEKEIDLSIKNGKEKSDDSGNEYNNEKDDEVSTSPNQEEFTCLDINIKNYIGFNSDIVPGEIIREEIVEIATSKNLGLYRLEYFTKYYKVDELRNKLLKKLEKKNEEEKKEEEKKDEKNKNKNEENKDEEKLEEEEIKENEDAKKEEHQAEEEDEKKRDVNKEDKKDEDQEKKEDKKEENQDKKEDKKDEDQENKDDKKDEDQEKKEDKKDEDKENKDDKKEENQEKKDDKKEEDQENKDDKKDEGQENKDDKKDEGQENKDDKKDEGQEIKDDKKDEEKEKKEDKKDEKNTEENKDKKEEDKNKENKKEEIQDNIDDKKEKDNTQENKEEKKEEDKTEENKEEKKEEDKTEENKEEKKEEDKTEENKEDKKEEDKTEENKEDKKEEDHEHKEDEKEHKDTEKEEEKKKSEEKSNNNEKDSLSEEKLDGEDIDNKQKKEDEDIMDEEKIETEINDRYDYKNNTRKFDVSEKNENSFIFNMFNQRTSVVILEDKSVRNKNKVKSTLLRFTFVNGGSSDKKFTASIKKQSSSNIIKINYFIPKEVNDKVEHRNMVNFSSTYRIRGDLPFLKKEDIAISINF